MAKEVEDISSGFIIAGTLICLIIFMAVLWAPVSYYLGKWSDYWDTRDATTTGPTFSFATTTAQDAADQLYSLAISKAVKDCGDAVEKYYNQSSVGYVSSATLDTFDGLTYDCHGSPLGNNGPSKKGMYIRNGIPLIN